ncbi:hypothetical protein TSAR_001774 [Trichomalopsis sarcophagae]|uniref:Uncharacterized protein n=1 Tax=Trichomalopsis sarcophagae TaxID=543379 RepID=A0A232EJ62_9HYME|nr:hypothetical protein TSAR_001774 [Trichomalopsis sarcophagae]
MGSTVIPRIESTISHEPRKPRDAPHTIQEFDSSERAANSRINSIIAGRSSRAHKSRARLSANARRSQNSSRFRSPATCLFSRSRCDESRCVRHSYIASISKFDRLSKRENCFRKLIPTTNNNASDGENNTLAVTCDFLP